MNAPAPNRVVVRQGDTLATSRQNVVFTTLLGSCVGVCMYDDRSRVGGINHFLLSGVGSGASDSSASLRYGSYAMELLVNEMMKEGARRSNLVAHIFGGARMIAKGGRFDGQIGVENVRLATDFLRAEGIRVDQTDTGGTRARRIEFTPHNGKIVLTHIDALVDEKPAQTTIRQSEVTLF